MQNAKTPTKGVLDSLDDILDAPIYPFLTEEQKDYWANVQQQFRILSFDITEGNFGKRWEALVETLKGEKAIVTFPFGSWHSSRISKLRDLIKDKGPVGPLVLLRIALGEVNRTYWLKRVGSTNPAPSPKPLTENEPPQGMHLAAEAARKAK